ADGGSVSNVYNDVGAALTALNANNKVFNERFGGIDTKLSSLDSRVDDLDKKTLQWSDDKGGFSADHDVSGPSKLPSTVPAVPGSVAPGGAVVTKSADPNKLAKITDLHDGENPTDAVNVGQLRLVDEKVAKLDEVLNGKIGPDGKPIAGKEPIAQQVARLEDVSVKYATGKDGVKLSQVDLQGSDPDAPVLIRNVADGKDDSDAATVGQVRKSVAEKITEVNKVASEETTRKYEAYAQQSKTYTDNETRTTLATSKIYTDQGVAESKSYTDEGVAKSMSYTDQQFNKLSSDIGSVRSEARQAAAIGLAASSLRFDNTPGKISVAMGGGFWRDQGAMAFGAGYTSESGAVRANLTGVTSAGQVGVAAGLSFTLN
ncbi:MAG: YadA-like family protein, partial [Phyllobacterium sp.]